MTPDGIWANAWRAKLKGWLRQAQRPTERRLATILANCSAASPCFSAACPNCGLRFQNACLSALSVFMGPAARKCRGRKSQLTIVPCDGFFCPGKLEREHILLAKADMAAALQQAALGPALGCMDVSCDEDPVDGSCCWSIHAHAVVVDWPSTAQIEVLQRAFPRSQHVHRPVMVQRLDDRPAGAAYAFKPQRFRRVSQPEVDEKKQAPRQRVLRVWQATELARVEHALGFRGRLIFSELDPVKLGEHFNRFWK